MVSLLSSDISPISPLFPGIWGYNGLLIMAAVSCVFFPLTPASLVAGLVNMAATVFVQRALARNMDTVTHQHQLSCITVIVSEPLAGVHSANDADHAGNSAHEPGEEDQDVWVGGPAAEDQGLRGNNPLRLDIDINNCRRCHTRRSSVGRISRSQGDKRTGRRRVRRRRSRQ